MEPKKEVKASQPKKTAKTVRKLSKNYVEFGKKGDPITPEIEKALKAKGVPVSAVSE